MRAPRVPRWQSNPDPNPDPNPSPNPNPNPNPNQVLPRELRLQGSELQLQPVPEAAKLRAGPAVRSSGDDAPLAAGSQVEIRLRCAWGAAASGAAAWGAAASGAGASGPPSRGVTGIRTLASADSAHYTELGYDWQAQA